MGMETLPRLYAVADIEVLARRGVGLRAFALGLRSAGVALVQLRDKTGTPQRVLESAALLQEVFAGTDCVLLMNDRVDLAQLAGFPGVHVGQGDLSPEDARAVPCGPRGHRGPRIIGVSTHTAFEVCIADRGAADYLAIGPVFATGTKADAAPVVGLAGVRMARSLTRKPLVAIGGINRVNCRSVVDAGADAVAVISGLLVEGESVESVARDFLNILR